jgi:hypothetical protein
VILCIAAAGTECRGGERGIECPGFLRPACQAYRPAARLAECISCRPSKDGNREEAGAYNADCEQREGVLAGQLMGSPLKSLQGFGVPAESYGFANKRLAWETIAPLTPERLKPALA